MITGEEPGFPYDVVNLLVEQLKQIDPGETEVVKRPLDPTDADQTISVVAVDWSPDQKSIEMGKQRNPKESTIQRYGIVIQGLINDGDEERAIARHTVFSSEIRRMIYRHPVLQVALPQLTVESDRVRESISSWGVNSQRWMVDRRSSSFIFMSALEFWFTTTNTPT